MDGARDMTLAEFAKALHRAHRLGQQKNDDYRNQLRHVEERMRATLQMIAAKAERKEI